MCGADMERSCCGNCGHFLIWDLHHNSCDVRKNGSVTKWLTVLEDSWLKGEEDLEATRSVCFFCKVGMGGDGSLCKFMRRIFSLQRKNCNLQDYYLLELTAPHSPPLVPILPLWPWCSQVPSFQSPVPPSPSFPLFHELLYLPGSNLGSPAYAAERIKKQVRVRVQRDAWYKENPLTSRNK